MQAGVDVLHHVLGGGQVPDHEQRQPDQFAVVLAEQRAHGTHGLAGWRRPRQHEASVSHRFRPSGGRPGN
jgi:hypothetical protein